MPHLLPFFVRPVSLDALHLSLLYHLTPRAATSSNPRSFLAALPSWQLTLSSFSSFPCPSIEAFTERRAHLLQPYGLASSLAVWPFALFSEVFICYSNSRLLVFQSQQREYNPRCWPCLQVLATLSLNWLRCSVLNRLLVPCLFPVDRLPDITSSSSPFFSPFLRLLCRLSFSPNIPRSCSAAFSMLFCFPSCSQLLASAALSFVSAAGTVAVGTEVVAAVAMTPAA